jgi:hypothetical protein
MTPGEVIAELGCLKTRRGDVRAFAEIADGTAGKPPQSPALSAPLGAKTVQDIDEKI